MQVMRGPTLASWTLPAWDRGRSSEAWRTKNTRMRPAMRSTSAPAKLALGLLTLGLNLDRYSTLETLSHLSGLLLQLLHPGHPYGLRYCGACA